MRSAKQNKPASGKAKALMWGVVILLGLIHAAIREEKDDHVS